MIAYIVHCVPLACTHITMYIQHPPENKSPSKVIPLPSLTITFLHGYIYFCLDYKPPPVLVCTTLLASHMYAAKLTI